MENLTEEKICNLIDVKVIEVKKEILEEVDKKIDDLEEDVESSFEKMDKSIRTISASMMSKEKLENMIKNVEDIMQENHNQNENIRDILAKFNGTFLADVTTTFLFFRTRLGRLLVSGFIYVSIIMVMFIMAIISPKANEIILNNTKSLLVGNGLITIALTVFTSRLKGGEKNER